MSRIPNENLPNDRSPSLRHKKPRKSSTDPASKVSGLFLHVQSAADYFTLNDTLMKNVPRVHADLILDPFLMNVFPMSLVPTAVHIAVVTVGAFGLAWMVWKMLDGVSSVARVERRVEVESKKKL